jgi:hypothetical protein
MNFKLFITIPKREDGVLPYEKLLARLKWLESPQCRATMKESDRIEERAQVTREFREVLKVRDFLQGCNKYEVLDPLYS